MSIFGSQPNSTSGSIAPVNNEVPRPTTLLTIQLVGGFLSLLPILSLNQFANLSSALYRLLVFSAVANIVISATVLVCFVVRFRYLLLAIDRIGELGICRILILYDILMLGGLVYLTGGSEKSAFAPQFAAILPVAVLIRDKATVKWVYAAAFLLMFLLGLDPPSGEFQSYKADSNLRQNWFLVFFFIFTLFPVIYSIQSESSQPNAITPPNVGPTRPAPVPDALSDKILEDDPTIGG